MSRWLVTGGTGFLGINLIRELVNRGHEVVSLDIEPFDYPDMKDRIDHHVVDIRDREAWTFTCRRTSMFSCTEPQPFPFTRSQTY